MARKHQGEILADAKARREAKEARGSTAVVEVEPNGHGELPNGAPELPTVAQLTEGVPVEEDGAQRAGPKTITDLRGKEKPRKADGTLNVPCKRGHNVDQWRRTPKGVDYCNQCYKSLRIEQAARKAAEVAKSDTDVTPAATEA